MPTDTTAQPLSEQVATERYQAARLGYIEAFNRADLLSLDGHTPDGQARWQAAWKDRDYALEALQFAQARLRDSLLAIGYTETEAAVHRAETERQTDTVTQGHIERPENECEICRQSSAGAVGLDQDGDAVYPEGTKSVVLHEAVGLFEKCRSVMVCGECRVGTGPVAGPNEWGEDSPYDEECECAGDEPQVWADWGWGKTWIVRRIDGEIVEAAGPVDLSTVDAIEAISDARIQGVVDAIAADVRMRALALSAGVGR